jgi:ParB-like chromosome segregation protein Spo0J
VSHPRRESFGPEEIVVPDRLRAGINEVAVAGLVASISKIGLRTPLSVRWDKEQADPTIVLIAGRHRLEACKRLEMPLIDCIVFDDSETDARLWEIAENLHRADLTVVERSEHIAEWVRLTEAQEKSHEAQLAPHRKAGQQPGGINAAVRELGIDRTEAQRSIKVAALPEEAKEAARETGLDNNQSALLKAAKAPPQEAAAVIREIADLKTAKAARLLTEEEAKEVRKLNSAEDTIIKDRQIEEFIEYLADRLVPEEMHVAGHMALAIHPGLGRAMLREIA